MKEKRTLTISILTGDKWKCTNCGEYIHVGEDIISGYGQEGQEMDLCKNCALRYLRKIRKEKGE